MEKRTSFGARVVAVIALVGAAIVLIVAVSGALSGSSSSTGKDHRDNQHVTKRHRTTAKAYVVKSGDTLTAIAHKTGVPVAQILALNPEVDPQILIAGQTLKLR